MSYSPPGANNVDFAAPGSYTPPSASAVDFAAGDGGTTLAAAGVAQATGTAALAQHSLSATGTAAATGTAKLALQSQLQADGTAVAVGTAALARRSLAATGTALATAQAQLARQGLVATATATATGTARLRHTNQLRASGTAVATGSAVLRVQPSLSASGVAAATGIASLSVPLYAPPPASAVDFAATAYTTPPADAVNFPGETALETLSASGAATATGTAILRHTFGFSAAGEAVADGAAQLRHTTGFVAAGTAEAVGTGELFHRSLAAAGEAVAAADATMALVNVSFKAPGIVVDTAARYGTRGRTDRQAGVPWGRRPTRDATTVSLYGALAGVERQLGLPWGSRRPEQRQVGAPWGAPLRRPQAHVGSPWEDLDHVNERTRSPWGSTAPRQAQAEDQWIVPPAKDRQESAPFDSADPTRTEANPADVFGRYEPPAATGVNFAARSYTPPAATGVDFGDYTPPPNRRIGPRGDLYAPAWRVPDTKNAKDRLPWGPRGSRDRPGITTPYDQEKPEPPPEPPPLPPELEVYLLMPSITASRVSDGAEITVNQASVTLDRDSFTWQMGATLARTEDLDFVRPTSSGPVAMDLTINGRTWRCIVESYRRQRQFNSSSIQIEGRGQAAALTSPYVAAGARTETEQRTANQLANDELEFTDWSIVWDLQDWTVPGGVYSYQERTPLQSIQRIAEAAGGVVYAERVNKVLHVEPRFPVSPWDWDSTAADVGITDNVMTSLSLDWEPGPPHNAVWVAGRQQGVLVHVVRDNTNQDNEAPQVTDGLITERLAGRERGRMILAQAGDRARVPIVTTLFPSDPPGLITPGQLVEVTEDGETWRGQAQSVTVDASRESAASVRQTVEIDRWYGP